MKRTSSSQANGEVFTPPDSGVKIENPVHIIIHTRGKVMNKLTTIATQETTASVVGMGVAKTYLRTHQD